MSSPHICSPRDQDTKNLEIRQANTQFEIAQLRAALNTGHYLKGGRPAGNTIWEGGATRPMSMKTTLSVRRPVLVRSGTQAQGPR
jgi:hypothetical protein